MGIGRVGIAVAVAAVGLLCAAPAGASSPGLDPSYGQGGVLKIEPPAPDGYQSVYVEGVAVSPGGAAFALDSASTCAFPCGAEGVYLHRYLPSGALDRSFGSAGAVRLPLLARRRSLAVDDRGRALLVSSTENGLIVTRYTAAGVLDPSFGHKGSVALGGGGGSLPEALAAPRHRILVVEGRSIEAGESEFQQPQSRAHRIRLVLLRENGSVDAGFGHKGALTVDLPGNFGSGISFTEKGAMLFGGRGCCGEPITVTRITAKGVLDTRFDAIAARSLGRLGGLGGTEIGDETSLGAVMPRRGGGLDLLGGDGVGAGFDLRLRGDGRLAARFGERGLKRLPVPIAEAVAGTGDAIFALSGTGKEPSVLRLLPSGRLDPAFGGGQPVPVPSAAYSRALTPVSHGRVVAVSEGTQECQGYCPPTMTLTRFVEPAEAHGRGGRQR